MNPIDPRPKSQRVPEERPPPFRITSEFSFVQNNVTVPELSFQHVLEGRVSSTRLNPILIEEVTHVVRSAFQATHVGVGALSGRLRRRAVSAGALHPIRCLLFDERRVCYYDHQLDKFFSVEILDSRQWSAFLSSCKEVMPGNEGVWIIFFADSFRTSSAYEQSDSLVWRDAGAMLQLFSMICYSWSLAFCPLGLLGQDGLEALVVDREYLIASGVAALGKRPVGV